MRLRQLFEAPEKTAAFAFGRLNPATNGHELLVEEIKKQSGDSFLFLSDRAPKIPTDPLSSQEKLDWAQKSFNGIAIGLAKSALIAADRLHKMGYTNLIYLEGEPKMGKVIQTYNGQEKDLHSYNFKTIDLVRLSRDPDAEDPTGMSASKLRQTVMDNNLEAFKAGVTKSALPYAEEMFKKLQGIMGVDSVEEGDKKNCGCGKDPCITYGQQQEAYDPEYGHDSFSHVVKHKDDNGVAFWAVYNHEGKIVKTFYSEKSASKFADKNHDALMKDKIKANERELSKSEIKKRDKTADKIMDKPKAKSSIANWARDKGMDPEGAVYAIATNMAKKKKKESIEEKTVEPGNALPKKIKVIKMPNPPKAPSGPDRTEDNGTSIKTTKKGNRSVSSGAGTYIFTPKGKLILYMTPRIKGLVQTHNLIKKTVTVNYGTTVDAGGDVNVDQKGTYDMNGNIISGDNTTIQSGGAKIGIDKDKGFSLDYRISDKDTISANSKTGLKVKQNDEYGNIVSTKNVP